MTREKFLGIRNSGIAVDDDNEHVPDNITVATTVENVSNTAIDRNVIAAADWGFDGVDQRRKSGSGVFSTSKLKTTDSSSIPHMSILDFLLIFYPCDYIKVVITPQTNKNLYHGDMEFSEFLRFFGC